MVKGNVTVVLCEVNTPGQIEQSGEVILPLWRSVHTMLQYPEGVRRCVRGQCCATGTVTVRPQPMCRSLVCAEKKVVGDSLGGPVGSSKPAIGVARNELLWGAQSTVPQD